jgi:hypothetical protein
MLVKRTILILLSILILTGTVNAYYANPGPGATHFLNPVGPEEQWIIADIGQQNTITLVAYNDSMGYVGPVKNSIVTFFVDDPSFGSIIPQTVTTDVAGTATSTFTVNSTHPKSGTATINAIVQSSGGVGNSGELYSTTLTWDQKIDHSSPDIAEFTYDTYGDVASVLPVNIVITDRWGNLIDDRFEKAHTPTLPLHNLTLHVNGPSPPNDCGFTDFGLVHDHEFSLDPNGEVAFNITSATKPGWHYILMNPMGNMPEQMKLFKTVSMGVPFSITQTYSPDGDPYPTLAADGVNKFVFYYTIYDKYGTPTTNQGIRVTITSLDRVETPQEQILISGDAGQNWSSFGPKSFTNRYSINATTLQNSTIWVNKTVRFVNTTPSNIDVQANPESMPSLDANPSIYSTVYAKVTDVMGNGVPGQTVSFAITSGNNNTVTTKDASFSSAGKVTTGTGTTDTNGYATIQFYPGAFPTSGQPYYNESATGTSLITATWNSNERDVRVTWKNYAYLSAVVNVTPGQVKVGDSVNISIKLNGDGWALTGKPADIVIVTDLAGGIGGTGRLANTKAAEIAFVNNASEKTFISLVTFGRSPTEHGEGGIFASANAINLWNEQQKNNKSYFQAWSGAPNDTCMVNPANWNAVYTSTNCNGLGNCPNVTNPMGYYYLNPSSDGKIEKDFTTDKAALISVINSYQDYGGTNYGAGINAAIKEFNTHGTPGHSKTIIIMGDGINMMAPIAPGSLESYWPSDWYPRSTLGWLDESDVGKAAALDAANRARAQGITIYGAGFPTPIGSNKYIDTDLLTQMSSPGCYYPANSTAELSDIFQKILGKVQTEASVDTEASLDFGSVIVGESFDTGYFEYIGDPVVATGLPATWPGSTMIDKYNKTPGGVIDQHFSPGSDDSNNPFTSVGPIILNQTDYWKTTQKLHFNISTIKVNETWQTDFRLKVLKEGNIRLFSSPSSKINFNNGMAGASSMTLPNISLLSSMNPVNLGMGQNTIDIIGLTRTDTGEVKGTIPVTWTMTYNGLSTNPITEEVSYIHDNDPPIKFAIITGTASELTGHIQTATLNTEKLPPGGYSILVHAYAPDATVTKYCGPYTYSRQGRAFIKLE